MNMALSKKCRIRIQLRKYIKEHIHRKSLYLTERRKEQTQIAFILHLQLTGVLEKEEEIEEIKLLTRHFLNLHHQLQDRFGLAFLKNDVENEDCSD
jgi:hypothetical protein